MVDQEQFPFRFTCRRSGNCCSIPGGVVRVRPEEKAAIAGFLGLDPESFASRYLAPGGDLLAAGMSSRCVFLDDGRTASCSIYEVPPEKCRTWPYWEELLQDPARLQRAANLCPGIARRDDGDEFG